MSHDEIQKEVEIQKTEAGRAYHALRQQAAHFQETLEEFVNAFKDTFHKLF